jgi:uncharacterized protein (DUF1697 family)
VPETFVALFRGINVGTAKRVAMADLRALFERLGYGDVRTLLNSGNVVFTATGKGAGGAAARIEKEVGKRLGVTSRVTVLTGKELAEAVAKNPLGAIAANASRLLVLVPWDAKALAELKPLLREEWKPERLALGRRVAWLWCADGIRDSALWAAANRALGDRGTARNLATMTKLVALCEASRRA